MSVAARLSRPSSSLMPAVRISSSLSSTLSSSSSLLQLSKPSLLSRSFASKSSSSSSSSFEIPIMRPFKGHKLASLPENTVKATGEELLAFFREMSYFRRFEIVADTAYKQRLIRGFCHLYDGQEAVLSGMEASIKRTDSLITSYRDHCHQISRGDQPKHVMAELFGKETGCSKGKGGSMHMYFKQGNFYGGNGIVGAQIPLGVGVAFAHKYKGDGGLCVAAMGDGAANQGQVYEAANMAALWKLPVIFLIENNEYGMGTSTKRAAASPDFYTRGDYIPGLWIDGMDVLACREGFRFAAEHVRTQGPMFVEVSTYRYHGHSMSDPGISYRSRDEVSEMRAQRDPIERVRHLLLSLKIATEADIKKIEKDIRVEVDATAEFAKESKELPYERLFTEIYKGQAPPFIRLPDFRRSVSAAEISTTA